MLQGNGSESFPLPCSVFGPVVTGAVGVSWRRAVRLICAGWLPQDGLFGWDATAGV